jgi:hypothetical protein
MTKMIIKMMWTTYKQTCRSNVVHILNQTIRHEGVWGMEVRFHALLITALEEGE